MIEDLQDEITQYTPDETKPNKDGMLLLVFIVWVIFSAVIIIASRPKIVYALEQTNAVQVFKNRKNLKAEISSTLATLYFVNQKSPDTFGLIAFKAPVQQTGASVFHDAVEGLLKGPSDAALKHGAVSAIPYGTKLVGLTVSNKVAFVSFSKEFIQENSQPDYVEQARWQLLKTLQSVDSSLRYVVILVNNQEM